ncbi:MAG: HEPN domain-containing protein [Phycisphaerales bacterium]|nr:MAG: HEPN domain-containing protein [Phycisphaerales bacterium]
MHANSPTIIVAGEWVTKAENDLKNAAHTLKLGKACPTDTVGFHAQQCAEKYLKAFLVYKGIDFTRTHEIERLVALLPKDICLNLSIEEQRRLTGYATMTRYPGAYEPISLAEARQSVRLARRVRRELRVFLPKEALRHRR